MNHNLFKHDTIIVFDRYYPFSIKSVTREARNVAQSSKQVKLVLNGPLPPKNVVLTNKNNKTQLIKYLVEALVNLELPNSNKKLIVTGSDPIPLEVTIGGLTRREDLQTYHEEADTIMVLQMLAMVEAGYTQIEIISDDTDVFILLLHHFNVNDLRKRLPKVDVWMNATSLSSKSVSISQTLASLPNNVSTNILEAHCLSGCDTISQMFSIGKKKVIKTLNSPLNFHLQHLGDTDPNLQWSVIENECVPFVCTLYGMKAGVSIPLSEMRYEKWLAKTKSKTMNTCFDLKYLPPTREAFRMNLKRAHYQCSIWKNVKGQTATELLPENFGWTKDFTNKTLDPIQLMPGTPIAPDFLLKLTFCGCDSTNPCASHSCGCKKANIKCSDLCKCSGNCINAASPENEYESSNELDVNNDDEESDTDFEINDD